MFTATEPTRNPEKRHAAAAASQLDRLVASILDLSLACKQAHWHVTGRGFLGLHREFEEIGAAATAWADRVAERSITLGYPVHCTARQIAAASPNADLPPGFLTGFQAVALIAERMRLLSDRCRDALSPLATADPVTEGVIVEIVAEMEKHLWMLEAEIA